MSLPAAGLVLQMVMGLEAIKFAAHAADYSCHGVIIGNADKSSRFTLIELCLGSKPDGKGFKPSPL